MKKRISPLKSYQFFINFLIYTDMKKIISFAYENNPYPFLKQLRKDYIELKLTRSSIQNALTLINNQINFVEKFLNDCGVNVYENC